MKKSLYLEAVATIKTAFPGKSEDWCKGVLHRAIHDADQLPEDELLANLKEHFNGWDEKESA